MKYEDSGMAAAERVLTSEQSRVVFLPFDIIDSARPDVEPFAYSPDGIGCDGTLAECKVPWRREIVPGLVKPNYDCQVQFGMHVIDGAVGLCDRTHFFEYRPPPNKYMLESEIFSVTQVARDAAWPSLHVWLLDEFWAEVTKYRSDHVMPDHYASEVRATKWLVISYRSDRSLIISQVARACSRRAASLSQAATSSLLGSEATTRRRRLASSDGCDGCRHFVGWFWQWCSDDNINYCDDWSSTSEAISTHTTRLGHQVVSDRSHDRDGRRHSRQCGRVDRLHISSTNDVTAKRIAENVCLNVYNYRRAVTQCVAKAIDIDPLETLCTRDDNLAMREIGRRDTQTRIVVANEPAIARDTLDKHREATARDAPKA